HGRSFWIFDDLPLLYQMADSVSKADMHLFQPKDAYRVTTAGGFRGARATIGANPASGASIYFSLKDKPQGEVTLEFLDSAGKSVRKFSSKVAEGRDRQAGPVSAEEETFRPRGAGSTSVPTEPGLNKFVWDLRYPDATSFPGMVLWAGSVRGPMTVPGKYTVKLTANGKTEAQTFEILKDPRIKTTPQEFLSQLELELQIRDKLSKTNQAVIDIRDIRKQVDDLAARLKNTVVIERAKALSKELTAIEEALYQTKNKAREDPLNFPIRLNNKMAALLAAVEASDDAPTSQEQMVYEDLSTGINAQLKQLDQVISKDLPAFNKIVRDQDIPAVSVKAPAGTL
ncbi:MAG: glycosyl hydrolase, repeat-containing protein, partial [Bryobacterales bacterium]|nr:glycosyl hydrolase, repeat-containing protein [Bryobacterales bacterium]